MIFSAASVMLAQSLMCIAYRACFPCPGSCLLLSGVSVSLTVKYNTLREVVRSFQVISQLEGIFSMLCVAGKDRISSPD